MHSRATVSNSASRPTAADLVVESTLLVHVTDDAPIDHNAPERINAEMRDLTRLERERCLGDVQLIFGCAKSRLYDADGCFPLQVRDRLSKGGDFLELS